MSSDSRSLPAATLIRSALLRYRHSWLSLAAFGAAINLLLLVPSLYMLQVYDRVMASSNRATLGLLTLLALGLFAMMGALEYARSRILIRIGEDLDAELAPDAYDASFRRGLDGRPALAAQTLSDLDALRMFLTGNAPFAFFDAPWCPLFLLVLFAFHPLMGLLGLVGAVILALLAWLNEYCSRAWLVAAGTLSTEARQEADGQLRHAEAIAAMGMLGRLRGRWQRLHLGHVRGQVQASQRSALITAIAKSVRLALQSLALGLGAWLALDNRISPGMMIAGTILAGRVLAPIDQVIAAWRQWTQTRLSHQRLCTLLDGWPARTAGTSLPPPIGEVELDAVSAAPPGTSMPTVLGLSLRLAAGMALGVVGPSGSGKSTLARLLVGVWRPQVGCVRLDGADLKQWDRESLGRWIGYLPQDVELFAGTVAENIARFDNPDDRTERDARVIAAAQLAGVHELILKLPQGYDTRLQTGGLGLSGGQRQRVALARALYNEPRLVVLDEPNASLDEAGEQALIASLQRLREKRITVVVITHRPRVLTATQWLLSMRGGRPLHFGSTSELWAKWQKQAQQAQQAAPQQAQASVQEQATVQIQPAPPPTVSQKEAAA